VGVYYGLNRTIIFEGNEENRMFVRGQVYHRRSDIHARYGGQEQGGISTPRNHPYIFLFSSDSGEQHGYQDGWLDADRGLFRYSGQGQRGDMHMLRGNAAIRDHTKNGKELHLFEKVSNGRYRYAGEMAYLRHEIEERVVDTEGRTRTAIVFTLRSIDR
jgi:5-methylcytosine-specific restriction enzyme A